MAQEYDKIVKENILPSITTLLQKTIGVQIVKYEVVYPELTYTVDKEADFILLATDIQGIEGSAKQVIRATAPNRGIF
jgi:hypothetical protein